MKKGQWSQIRLSILQEKRSQQVVHTILRFFALPLIDKKERMQLAIKKIVAATVRSSMTVLCAISSSFNDVRTTKQSPNKLEEAFRMWGDDFSFFSFIVCLKIYKFLDFYIFPTLNSWLLPHNSIN